MKKTIIGLAFLGLTSLAFAQEKGIKFEQNLTWDQVKEKARKENKFIFVDVYASWCAPCKAMDKNVYANNSIADIYDNKFIAYKIQGDSSKADDNLVKEHYVEAGRFIKEYKVAAYPSLLFFSPEGKLVHRSLGYKDPQAFKQLTRDAQNPSTQFYSLLESYSKGNKDYPGLIGLARQAKDLGYTEIYKKIAADYVNNYLSKISDEKLFTKENLELVGGDFSLINTNSRIFKLIYKHPAEANALVDFADYAKQVIGWKIYKEEIESKLWASVNPPVAIAKSPDWKKISTTITKKYSKYYADSLVVQAQIGFYATIKDWSNYVRYVEKAISKFPPKLGVNAFSAAVGGFALIFKKGDFWGLNEAAWTIFEGTNDTSLLEKALGWSELSLKIEQSETDGYVQCLDTYANLLYKLGKTKEAIEQEQKAMRIESDNAKKQGNDKNLFANEFFETLEKMKKGEPTWPVSDEKGNRQSVVPLYSRDIPDNIGSISENEKPKLTIYLPSKEKATKTGIIIFPGGAYSFLATETEGTPIAQAFAEKGITAFVVKYRLPNDATMLDKSMGPLMDAQQAIKYVRMHTKDYGLDSNKIGIIGYSAGGHLASTLGTHFSRSYIQNKENTNLRPDFMILVYPVISMKIGLTHFGSMVKLLGANPTEEKVNFFSSEENVTDQTPPTYLTHCGDDQVVSVNNSIVFYQALQKKGVHTELHLYPKGNHGFTQFIPVNEWLDPMLVFLRREEMLK